MIRTGSEGFIKIKKMSKDLDYVDLYNKTTVVTTAGDRGATDAKRPKKLIYLPSSP